jgi:hypothetical protein
MSDLENQVEVVGHQTKGMNLMVEPFKTFLN